MIQNSRGLKMRNELNLLELRFLNDYSSISTEDLIEFLESKKYETSLLVANYIISVLKEIDAEEFEKTSINPNFPFSDKDNELIHELSIFSKIFFNKFSISVPNWLQNLYISLDLAKLLSISRNKEDLKDIFNSLKGIAKNSGFEIIENGIIEKDNSITNLEKIEKSKISESIFTENYKETEESLPKTDESDEKIKAQSIEEIEIISEPAETDSDIEIAKTSKQDLKTDEAKVKDISVEYSEDTLETVETEIIDESIETSENAFETTEIETIGESIEPSDDTLETVEIETIDESLETSEEFNKEPEIELSSKDKVLNLIDENRIDDALNLLEMDDTLSVETKVEILEEAITRSDSSNIANLIIKYMDSSPDELLEYIMSLYEKTHSRSILKIILSRLLESADYMNILKIYEDLLNFSDENLHKKTINLIRLSEEKNDFSATKILYDFCMTKWPKDENIFDDYITFLAKNNDFKALISIADQFSDDNNKIVRIIEILDEFEIENLQIYYLKLNFFESINDMESFSEISIKVLSQINDIQLGMKTLKYCLSKNKKKMILKFLSIIQDINDFIEILLNYLKDCKDTELFISISERLCESSEILKPEILSKSKDFINNARDMDIFNDSLLSSFATFYIKNGDPLSAAALMEELKINDSDFFDEQIFESSLIYSEQYSKIINLWKNELEKEQFLNKLESLLPVLESKNRPHALSELLEEICKINPTLNNYKKYCLLMIKSGNLSLSEKLIIKIFNDFKESLDFCLNTIRTLKSEGYFPSSIKEIYILILLKLKFYDELIKELSRWGEIFLSENMRRNSIINSCMDAGITIPMLNVMKKSLSKQLYLTLLRSTTTIAKNRIDLDTLEYCSRILITKYFDIDYIRDILHIFIKNSAFNSALSLIKLLDNPWILKDECINIWKTTKDNEIFWTIIRNLFQDKDIKTIKEFSKEHYENENDFLSELKLRGLKDIYISILKISESSFDKLKELIDSSDWEAVYTITKKDFLKNPENASNYKQLIMSISKLKDNDSLREDIIELATQSPLNKKIDIYIAMDEFDEALEICNKLIISKEFSPEYIFEKLDELKFKRYLKEHKYDPFLSLSLAKLYKEKGELKKCAKELETYLLSYPNDQKIGFELCKILEGISEYERAIPYIKKLIQLSPENRKFKELYSKFNQIVMTNKIFTLK